jgi:hypothetical protein
MGQVSTLLQDMANCSRYGSGMGNVLNSGRTARWNSSVEPSRTLVRALVTRLPWFTSLNIYRASESAVISLWHFFLHFVLWRTACTSRYSSRAQLK